MAVSADTLLVIATLVTGFSLAAIFSAWADRVWPVVSLISLAIALGLFAFVHLSVPGGLTWQMVPNAFINTAAQILN